MIPAIRSAVRSASTKTLELLSHHIDGERHGRDVRVHIQNLIERFLDSCTPECAPDDVIYKLSSARGTLETSKDMKPPQ